MVVHRDLRRGEGEHAGWKAEGRIGAASAFPKVADTDPVTPYNQKYSQLSSIFICKVERSVRRSAHVCDLGVGQ